MRKKSAVGMALLASFFLTGCATLAGRPLPPLVPRSCSETPRHTVLKFIEGIIEWSLAPIRLVIAEGKTVLGIFGGEDEKKGAEIARQLWRHPEVLERESEAVIQRLDPLEMADLGNGETRVLMERKDLVTTTIDQRGAGEAEKITETIRTFRRNFAVRFQKGTNCIIAVRPLDQQWERVP